MDLKQGQFQALVGFLTTDHPVFSFLQNVMISGGLKVNVWTEFFLTASLLPGLDLGQQ